MTHLLFRQGEPLPTILALFIFSSLGRICFGTAIKLEGIWHSFVHSPSICFRDAAIRSLEELNNGLANSPFHSLVFGTNSLGSGEMPYV
jgi:hypothetical protein